MSSPSLLRNRPTEREARGGAFHGDLARVGRALLAMLDRDELPPFLWLSTEFASRVAAIRSGHSALLTTVALEAARRRFLERQECPPVRDFATAVQRLARDPAEVAFGLRVVEIQRDVRLAPWPDLVRRRGLVTVGRDPRLDVSIWFG